jgi:predicted choloylglycine hydrolase
MKPPTKLTRVSILQCRGAPYEAGRAQARWFAATPKGRAFLRKKTIRLPWWLNLKTEERMFAKYAPALWEELVGLADELGISMERAALRFGNDGMRPPIGACSAAMTGAVYGRNYDNRPLYYSGQFTLLQMNRGYASIGSTHELTGRLDGMNEHGLMIGLHRIAKRPRFPGLSADLIVRLVLDQCATTAEAVTKLRELPHAMQYNYSVLDAKGAAAVVEAPTYSFAAILVMALIAAAGRDKQAGDGIKAHGARALPRQDRLGCFD